MRRVILLGLVSAVLALPVQDVPTVFQPKEDPKALCYTTGPVAGDPCTFCKCFSPGNCIPVTAECDWNKNEAEHKANGCEPEYRQGICCPTVKCPEGPAATPETPAELPEASATTPTEPAAEVPEAPAAAAGYGQAPEVPVATEPEAPAEPAVVEAEAPAAVEVVAEVVPAVIAEEVVEEVPVVVEENVGIVPVIVEEEVPEVVAIVEKEVAGKPVVVAEVVEEVPVAVEVDVPVLVETVAVEPEVVLEPVAVEPVIIEEVVPVETESETPVDAAAAYDAGAPVSEPVVSEPQVPVVPEADAEAPAAPETPAEPEVAEPEVSAEPEVKKPETSAEPKVTKPETPVTGSKSSSGYRKASTVPSLPEKYFKASLEGKDADAKPGIVLAGTSALQLAEEIAEPEDQLLEATMTMKQLQLAQGAILESTAPEQLAAEISNHYPDDKMIQEVISEITGPGAEVIGEIISEMNAAPAEAAIEQEIKEVDPNPQQTQEVVLEMTPEQIKKVIAALSPADGVVSQDAALEEVLTEMALDNETTVVETADATGSGEVITEIITKKEPIVIASREPLIVVSDQPVVVVSEQPVLDNGINSVYSEGPKPAYNAPDEELLPAESVINETVFLETVPEPEPELEASGLPESVDVRSLFPAEAPGAEELVEGSGA